MQGGQYFIYNGKLLTSGTAVITADNRSLRFGDGFFETMKMVKGNITLSDYHFERFFSSLQILQFKNPAYLTADYLLKQVQNLAAKNKHTALARIRLNVFRGDGNLYEFENNSPNYIFQTWALQPEALLFNKEGLITDIYTNARKSCDDFSHIKHNNFLPYAMAALWAKEKKLDDAFVLNNYNRIADSTIANIFLVNDGKIKTPALSEGCISGVMRKYLLACLKKERIPVEETCIETAELAEASELFLTNAIRGIQWVKQCGKHSFNLKLATYLQHKFLS